MLLASKNRAESDRQALREHKMKLEIESRFIRDLRPLFSRMSRDFKQSYSEAQTIPSQAQYKQPLKKTILKYNTETAQIFCRNIRDDLKKGIDLFEVKSEQVDLPEEKEDDISASIATAVAIFVSDTSEDQTTIILDTNERQMREAATRAKQQANAGKEIVSWGTIAAKAATSFKANAQSRIDSIAQLNVGMVQSFSKQTEAEVLNGSEATIDGEPIKNTLKKQWNAILDNRTRPAHVQADAQYMPDPIEVENAFTVDGEELMYPRDPAGSAGNIINCRCEEQIVQISD